MPHIVGKKIGGQTYYYLREMARVDGKPKVVSQTYLGKADDIAAAVAGSGPTGVEPERSRHLAFGDLAAVCVGGVAAPGRRRDHRRRRRGAPR